MQKILGKIGLLLAFCVTAQICLAQKTETPPKADKSGVLRVGDPKKHGIKEADLTALREILQKVVADKTAPGASVILIHKGEIVFKEGFGDLPADKQAFIASTTKPLTTTAVLTVVDDGKLNLDDKISKYLPEFKGTKVENATVRQLLSHTAGIGGDYPDGRPKTGTLAEFSRSIAARGKLTEPGTFNYSGVGMDIAQRVAEVAAGKNFEEIIKTRVFEPLGMKNTSYRLAADAASVKAGESRYTSGGGGLDSTLDDLAAFFQMHLNGGEYGGKRILSRKMIDEMHRQQSVPINNPAVFGDAYGLGMSLYRVDEKTKSPLTFGHAGAFGTMGFVDVDRDLVCVVLTQVPLKQAAPIINSVRDQVRRMIPAKR